MALFYNSVRKTETIEVSSHLRRFVHSSFIVFSIALARVESPLRHPHNPHRDREQGLEKQSLPNPLPSNVT